MRDIFYGFVLFVIGVLFVLVIVFLIARLAAEMGIDLGAIARGEG